MKYYTPLVFELLWQPHLYFSVQFFFNCFLSLFLFFFGGGGGDSQYIIMSMALARFVWASSAPTTSTTTQLRLPQPLGWHSTQLSGGTGQYFPDDHSHEPRGTCGQAINLPVAAEERWNGGRSRHLNSMLVFTLSSNWYKTDFRN